MSWPPMGSAPQSNFPSALRRSYMVAERAGVSFALRGPYLAVRIPTSGSLQVIGDTAGQIVQIDERVYLPLASNVRVRSLLTDVVSGVSWEVVEVKAWPEHIECFVRRQAPDA